jgi:mono/diheme cytochrome c family protein
MKQVSYATSVLAALLAVHAFAQEPSDWQTIASVLKHPRCINCHGIDFPRQGDDGHPHEQRVVRGEHDDGAPTLHCAACHQTTNSLDGRVPGAPGWEMAHKGQQWETLDDAALCALLKNSVENGGWTIEGSHSLRAHIDAPLVRWAWKPGDRTRPPVAYDMFVSAVTNWIAAGAPCPK